MRRKQLVDAYANHNGKCVAYIDESYVAPSSDRGTRRTFYLITAYVIDVDWIEEIRDALPTIVGANFWHSTDSHRTEEGKQKIRSFANYVGEGDEPVIVSMQRPIDISDSDGEAARRSCFKNLLSLLASGTHCNTVELAIFEERKYASQRNADARTVSDAIRESLIPRSMRVLATSPTYEKLLWLPDIVSFALYHDHFETQFEYAQPFRSRVQTVFCK